MRWLKGCAYVVSPLFFFLLVFYMTVNVLLKRVEEVVCPDVKGKAVEEAKYLVESKGLAFEVLRHEKRRDIPRNYITLQKPEANIPTRKGRVVMVVVSEGPPLVEVPILIGTPLEQAEEMLKVKGLGIEKVISVPGFKARNVVAQIPKGGEDVLEGGSVVLFANSGRSEYFLMPDVSDVSITDFSEEMESRNIRYRITRTRWGRFVPGAAMKTSVPPRTVFKASEEIEIKVNPGG